MVNGGQTAEMDGECTSTKKMDTDMLEIGERIRKMVMGKKSPQPTPTREIS